MQKLEPILKKRLDALPKAGSDARALFDKLKEAEPPIPKDVAANISTFLRWIGIEYALAAAKNSGGYTEIFIKDSQPHQVVGFAVGGDAFIDLQLLSVAKEKLAYKFSLQTFLLMQGFPVAHITSYGIALEVYKPGKDTPLASKYANI